MASGAHLMGSVHRLVPGGRLAPGAENLVLQTCAVFDDVTAALKAMATPQTGAAPLDMRPDLRAVSLA